MSNMQPSMTPTASASTASRGSTMALLGWAWGFLRPARSAPMLAVLVGALLSAVIVVSNARGVTGGVPLESVPLAIALILAGGFSLTVGALVIRRALTT
jgi:hypothetical protein